MAKPGPTYYSDPVILEISTAFISNVRIIPILVDDASMPKGQDLPPEVRRLSKIQAERLRHENFPRDIQRLIELTSRILQTEIG